MPANLPRIRDALRKFDFGSLFVEELGWDHCRLAPLRLVLDGVAYTLAPLAQKRGMVAYACTRDSDGKIPEYPVRRKLERLVAKYSHEHLIIFLDAAQSQQVWQWVKREPGRPTACREHRFAKTQSGESLAQKLQAITFSLAEEEQLTIVEVASRAKQAFDVDRLTRKFYEGFRTEHTSLLAAIRGIPDSADREWYASIMLNRLMFVYFIQKKGFLDNDPDYLKNHLRTVQARRGADQFLSFYRHFLIRLFHEGLGQRSRPHELDSLLGRIPYLNGGLFEVHQLERNYENIDIPDAAFSRIFDFFDTYQWHLDERPLRADNEINPDVLGYIFEKYINQRQMGAYYTKEDITGYMARCSILPYVLEQATRNGFSLTGPGGDGWDLLRDNPSRYISDPMLWGILTEDGNTRSLPEGIERGTRDVSMREDWNVAASTDFGLPVETWREHVNRRSECLSRMFLLQSGNVADVDGMITLNLDLAQFCQDLIERIDSPNDLRAMFGAISRVKVLDPTCGSGAFLFAALNILDPLYEACLDVMDRVVEEPRSPTPSASLESLSDLQVILDGVAGHPNRRYYVLKSIIVNNLFGVDLMEEAGEVCKLRLFLKLVAQVEPDFSKPNFGLEPLPDIDFNIRAGNSVVGFASYDEVVRALTTGQMKFGQEGLLDSIKQRAATTDAAFREFQSMQTAPESTDTALLTAKVELRHKLELLDVELNRYLASEYKIEVPGNPKRVAQSEEYQQWLRSHRPFHWFVEFYGIMNSGGFDVIIGNPPYVDKNHFDGGYMPINMRTLESRDIYAWFVERGLALRRESGRLGLIIPVSFASSEAFDPLRDVVWKDQPTMWLSHFANRPGQLFTGAQNRLTILLHKQSSSSAAMFSTRYHRWDAKRGERKTLFDTMRYVPLGDLSRSYHGLFPKAGDERGVAVLRKLMTRKTLGQNLVKTGKWRIYWVRVPGYFCQFFLSAPKARPENGGPERDRGELNSILAKDPKTQKVLHSILNSSTYYFFFCVYTDGRHINPSDVHDFPLDLDAFSDQTKDALVALSSELDRSMKASVSQWRKSGLLIDSVDSRKSKPVIDRIDRVLATHYGFTPDELDYIINYDIKYRMGQEEEEPED